MSNGDSLELGESVLPQTNYAYAYQVKFIIVGDSGAGKSNIILRFTHNEFKGELFPTLGLEYEKKNLIYNNTDYLIQLWDTAGQENFKSITRGYYKGSAVAMIVYDITNEQSFSNVENWIRDCKDSAPSTALLVLIGNKSDLEDKRVISKNSGEELAIENNMMFFETSALNGNGVNDAFQKCIEIIDEKIKSGEYNLDDPDNMDRYGIKKIGKDNDFAGRVDKKALKEGFKKSKSKKKCC